MKTHLSAALLTIMLATTAVAQNQTINSMSAGATQNQTLTGQTGHYVPPGPMFNGGAPDSGDRVSGTPANATTMHQESGLMTSTSENPEAEAQVGKQAIFESAGSPQAAKQQH